MKPAAGSFGRDVVPSGASSPGPTRKAWRHYHRAPDESPAGSAATARSPLDLGSAFSVVAPARHHEEEISESIQIADQPGLDRIALAQPHQPALGAPAHGPTHVELRPQRRAARKDELGEGRKIALEPVDPIF